MVVSKEIRNPLNDLQFIPGTACTRMNCALRIQCFSKMANRASDASFHLNSPVQEHWALIARLWSWIRTPDGSAPIRTRLTWGDKEKEISIICRGSLIQMNSMAKEAKVIRKKPSSAGCLPHRSFGELSVTYARLFWSLDSELQSFEPFKNFECPEWFSRN